MNYRSNVTIEKRNGELVGFESVVKQLKNILDIKQNGKYTISVSKQANKRTAEQNRLYRKWLSLLEEETGNSQDSLHEFFKKKFLSVELETIFGEEVRRVNTTTTLNTKEFTDYLDKVNAFVASELGIRLPQPNDMFFEI